MKPSENTAFNSDAPLLVQTGRTRPRLVSVVCILLWIGIALAMITYGGEQNKRIASLYAPYNLGYVLLQGICAFGMWRMKKWGFVGFFMMVATNLTIHFVIGFWSPVMVGVYLILCYFLARAMSSLTKDSEQDTAGQSATAE
ncbi:MAG: hypothetical protein ACSHX0_13135 [Akkermansiaceae bacterium]